MNFIFKIVIQKVSHISIDDKVISGQNWRVEHSKLEAKDVSRKKSRSDDEAIIDRSIFQRSKVAYGDFELFFSNQMHKKANRRAISVGWLDSLRNQISHHRVLSSNPSFSAWAPLLESIMPSWSSTLQETLENSKLMTGKRENFPQLVELNSVTR